jgi:hypothetical protein
MPGDPGECRQLAQDCLRLAQEATTDSDRQDYTALAYTWTELAHVIESDNALLESLTGAGSTVVPLQPRRPTTLRAA